MQVNMFCPTLGPRAGHKGPPFRHLEGSQVRNLPWACKHHAQGDKPRQLSETRKGSLDFPINITTPNGNSLSMGRPETVSQLVSAIQKRATWAAIFPELSTLSPIQRSLHAGCAKFEELLIWTNITTHCFSWDARCTTMGPHQLPK